MADKGFKRKLTAILSADAVGYSRLMRDDEDRTIRALTTYRSAITALVEKFRGHVVDATGDNLLAEFTSVVDAVNCGVEIQRELAERNSELPDERKMQFRIGINLGDVVKEEDRIYGDGVNIAARVESLAEPGGICISGSVHDSVESRLGLGFEYLGEQKVKNIDKPVRAYRVASYPGAAAHRVVQTKESLGKRWRKISIAVAAAVVIIGGLAFWQFYLRKPDVEPASMEKMSYALPDKPSIAILAFDNMSGDASLEYFSDGITEQIISALSKVPNLFVIARNSSFTYKGKAVKVQQVSEDLGVQYVLEGSVRKAGDRLRVTAQLIDAITGHHMWSETYDRELKDIFAIQDEITMKILTELQGQLTEGERVSVRDQHISNLQAYLKILEAKHFLNTYKHVEAIRLLEEARELDPQSATVYGFLSFANLMNIWFGPASTRAESLKKAFEFAEKCKSLDDNLSGCHQMLGHSYLMKREYDRAIAEGKESIDLDPNSALAALWYGWTLRSVGRYEDALSEYERAIRLDPLNTNMPMYHKCATYNVMRKHEDSIAICKKVLEANPKNLSAHYQLAVAYSFMDRMDEARESASEILKRNPNFTLENWAKSLPYKNQADIDLLVDGLRKAGLPDKPPLPLPDKPSIAVLAFDNLSGDPEQEYFCDGIAENIITALSKVRELFIIARNSSFTYKGKPVKVQQVSRELGVRYVLEGSVQKSSDRVRITAQLIDATNGQHIWAEKYDRELMDIFEIQDEITMKIVNAMRIELTEGETARIFENTKDLNVYLKVAQAGSLFNKGTKKAIIRYGQLAQEIIDAQPKSSVGYKLRAIYHSYLASAGVSPSENIKNTMAFAQKALTLDPSDAISHIVMAIAFGKIREYKKAIEFGRRSVELLPNNAIALHAFGSILADAEHFDEAISYQKQAIRLNPFANYLYYYHLGRCYFHKGQYEYASKEFKKGLERAPNSFVLHTLLASTYAQLDKIDEAREFSTKALALNPNISVSWLRKNWRYKTQNNLQLAIDSYRKAGFPEKSASQ
jgi:TolB-like protein/class 3 adenylate cyclase/Tfp pilus assembly protein PilF